MKRCRWKYHADYECRHGGWLFGFCTEHALDQLCCDFTLGRLSVSIDVGNVNRPYLQIDDDGDSPSWWAVSFGNGNSDPVLGINWNRKVRPVDSEVQGPPWVRRWGYCLPSDRDPEKLAQTVRFVQGGLRIRLEREGAVPIADATVAVSDSHSDLFIRNKVAVMADVQAITLRQPGLPALTLFPAVARIEARWARRPRPLRALLSRLRPA